MNVGSVAYVVAVVGILYFKLELVVRAGLQRLLHETLHEGSKVLAALAHLLLSYFSRLGQHLVNCTYSKSKST